MSFLDKLNDPEAIFSVGLFDQAPNAARLFIIGGFLQLIKETAAKISLERAIMNRAENGGQCDCEDCARVRKEKEGQSAKPI